MSNHSQPRENHGGPAGGSDVPRAEIALSLTLLSFATVSFILWPWKMVIGIPLLVAGWAIAFGVLWVLKRLRLANFWFSQLFAAVIVWPIALNEISLADTITRMRWTHAGLIMLAFAHIGGAIFWFTGVFRNYDQFPTVTRTFPYSSLLCLPLFALMVWGLIYTSIAINVWAEGR